jgi:putative membrane protein
MEWAMGWGMGFGWMWGLLFIVLIIWGVKTIAGNNCNSYINNGKEESPLEILKKRYASGGFDREEFKKRKSDLIL